MPKYIIERDIAAAGDLTAEELQGITQNSCSVPRNLRPQIPWIESHVMDDKVRIDRPQRSSHPGACATGGFSANTVRRIGSRLDPTTAETRSQHPDAGSRHHKTPLIEVMP